MALHLLFSPGGGVSGFFNPWACQGNEGEASFSKYLGGFSVGVPALLAVRGLLLRKLTLGTAANLTAQMVLFLVKIRTA